MDEQQQISAVKETFNAVSDDYDCPALRFFHESAKHLISILDLKGDERVLDVAAGTGHTALTLAASVPRGSVIGIDFSSGMLETARKKADSMGIQNVRFLEMNMQAVGLADERFDAATCAFGLFFVDDMQSQLIKIADTVKTGGKIAMCTFKEDYFQPLRDLVLNRLKSYGIDQQPSAWERVATETGCKELFDQAGLKDFYVEHKNMGYFLSGEEEWWDVVWNAGWRTLVSRLKPRELEQFRREHMQEVAALATEDGIWLDVGVLFTIGTKA